MARFGLAVKEPNAFPDMILKKSYYEHLIRIITTEVR